MTVQPTRDQLRALADAATPGPWSYADYGDPNPEHWPVGLIEIDDGEESWTCDTALAMSEPDAAFIAAARTAVPQLLDQLDQAEAELDSWMTRAYEAEKRAWQAEKRITEEKRLRMKATAAATEAEADRDWNLRSSRTAKKDRIEANARAERAEARVKAVRDALDADEHVTKQMGTLGQCRPDIPAIAHDTIRRALEG